MGKKRLYTSCSTPCCVTGRTPVDLHHVQTRGAGGGDEGHNLMPLIHEMHDKLHAVGLTTFAILHPEAAMWLVRNGWTFEPLTNKWRHYGGDA